MTDHDKLSEFLAVEVMGWHKGETWTWRKFNTAYFNSEKYDPNLASDEQTNYIIADNWSPPTNIEQAMMCLETFETWDIIKCHEKLRDDRYWVSIDLHKGVDGKSLPMAISLAVARARGYEDIK